MRSGLRFASASHQTRTLAITSSRPAEGKTWTAANLALVVAETGKRVLLIDADLRKPKVADAFGIIGAVGLTTVLIDAIPLQSAVQAWPRSTLEILPAGAVPPNPAELLASERMKELIQQVADEYDLVIIDTAPVLVVADATVIAQQVDSVLIVADTTRVRRAQLANTIEALERAGAHISGVVLNRVKPRPHDDYYYVRDEPEDAPGMDIPLPRRHAKASSGWPAHPRETLEPK